MEVVTKSAQETQKLGEKIANKLKKSASQRIFALYGELGSGKTTFIQGLAKGLGIKERILSPTFVMIRQYQITNNELLITNFYHVDLYRVESEKDARGLGLKEIWPNPENIVAIEWAEKIKKILPKKRTEIYFESLEGNKRRIRINSKA
jgi:tRNA threonylcarbamoyladenosine biosynthesis protein TsaE